METLRQESHYMLETPKSPIDYLGETERDITMDNQQATTNDLAWLAGFIDGEGSIGIYGTRRKDGSLNYGARIQVASVSGYGIKRVIDILKGMNVNSRIYQRKFDNPKYSDAFYVIVNRLSALARLLPELVPHLTIKKPHAELLYGWVSSRVERGINRGGNAKKNVYTEKEMDMIHALSELNKNRGCPTDYTCDPLLEGEDIVGSQEETL